MSIESIVANLVVSQLGSRGNQTRRKDRDLMRDTEGISKTLREPEQKPQRDDMRVRYRTKTKTRDEWDVDIDEDKDFRKGASCQE
jgi:hypothetical protein